MPCSCVYCLAVRRIKDKRPGGAHRQKQEETRTMTSTAQGPLKGLRVIEMAGIGPGPFCGMLLADMGAEVTLLERGGGTFASQLFGGGRKAVANRGKKSLCIDLKHPEANALVEKLIGDADVLLEGFRPGVMKRLGYGPEVCLELNPRLVYGRMTGWGQTGPLAQRAGHDANYAP